MKELWEEISNLQNIREDEEDIEWVSSRCLQFQDSTSPAVVEEQEKSLTMKLERENSLTLTWQKSVYTEIDGKGRDSLTKIVKDEEGETQSWEKTWQSMEVN